MQRPACLLAQLSRGCLCTRHTSCSLGCRGSYHRASYTGAMSGMAPQQIDITAIRGRRVVTKAYPPEVQVAAFASSKSVIREDLAAHGARTDCGLLCHVSTTKSDATFPVKLVNTSQAMLYRHGIAAFSSTLTVVEKANYVQYHAKLPHVRLTSDGGVAIMRCPADEG